MLSYYFFLFNSFNIMYKFNLINFVSFSYVLKMINHYYSTLLFFYKSYAIFCIEPIILSYFYKIIINKKKVTICNLDNQKPIQIKPH